MKGRIIFKGGKGSGNFGHSGRPGKRGGSGGGKGSSASNTLAANDNYKIAQELADAVGGTTDTVSNNYTRVIGPLSPMAKFRQYLTANNFEQTKGSHNDVTRMYHNDEWVRGSGAASVRVHIVPETTFNNVLTGNLLAHVTNDDASLIDMIALHRG